MMNRLPWHSDLQRAIVGTRPWRPIVFSLLLCVMAGCAARLDPRQAPTVRSTNAVAQDSFTEARNAFDRDQLTEADRRLAAFITHFADDPLVDVAQLYRGRIALRQGRPAAAIPLIRPVVTRHRGQPFGTQASYFLGLACARSGDDSCARTTLAPLLDAVATDARPAILAALATAEQRQGAHALAIEHFRELQRISDRPVEREYAREHLAASIAARPDLAPAATAAVSPQPDPNRPIVVGAVLPRTGPYRFVAERALAGIIGATRDPAATGGVSDSATVDSHRSSSRLVVDLAPQSVAATAAVEQLLGRQHVCVLVGALDSTATRAVAAIAERRGVPFLSLTGRDETLQGSGATTLQLLPSNDARASALAAYATERCHGCRTAIVAPSTGFGRTMAAAFSQRARSGGLSVVTQLSYPPNVDSFTSIAKNLAHQRVEVVFLPDRADTLLLLAPALALEGLWPAAENETPSSGRKIQLLSTADGASPSQLQRATRYLQGAVLAPGYFPTSRSADESIFLDQLGGQNRTPGLAEALAWDAIRSIQHAIDSNSQSPCRLETLLTVMAQTPGISGALTFDQRGLRQAPALLYTVRGAQVIPLAASLR